MTTWIRKARQIISSFLSTHDSKYIITDTNKKILITNSNFIHKSKSHTIWARKLKI